MIQKPYHKVINYLNKGYTIIGMVYWDNGYTEAIMIKAV